MAEEFGHYETADGDIIDQSVIADRKYELMGKKWSYRRLILQKDLEEFIQANETVHRYYLGEEFGIPDDVDDEAIQIYRMQGYI